jgi:LysM domain-containing protein
MKRMAFVTLLAVAACAGFVPAKDASAVSDEPTVYVIKQGDTLWGLSDRFLKDPHYWPDLWSRNQSITNPHLITPGQKVRIFPDRIELVPENGKPAEASKPVVETPFARESVAPPQEPVPEKLFVVSGAEGFLLEGDLHPAGFIISTYQNRQIVGEDDIVYTDIGGNLGAKPGDRFSIFKKMGAISHPQANVILGQKVIPLGTLQLSEINERVSKAIISKSYMEISAGSFLLPYREKRREVALKAATREFAGYIVETHTGNKAIAAGDVAFIDLGRKQGVEVGNMLYVVRRVELDPKFTNIPADSLPEELIGAVVVVETGENISTVLVVKSIDTVYRGDRVELKKR